MVLTNEQAAAVIAHANHTTDGGGDMPAEARCRYPSKRCDHVRTIKRGGGLHRLCTFHQVRANKNQWLVDQRRRFRRESDGSLLPRAALLETVLEPVVAYTPIAPVALSTLDVVVQDVEDDDVVSAAWPPLGNEDMRFLDVLLFDEQEDCILPEGSDVSDYDLADVSMEWEF